MTFWEFIDRQASRIRPTGVAGAGIFILTGLVLLMLYFDRTLADNDLFKTLSQAIVVQGLIGLAMAAWFTKKDDRAIDAHITNRPDEPVPTTEEGDA